MKGGADLTETGQSLLDTVIHHAGAKHHLIIVVTSLMFLTILLKENYQERM